MDEYIENLLNYIIRIPGIRIDRKKFLKKVFSRKYSDEIIGEIIQNGPIEAGIKINELDLMSDKLMKRGILGSSMASVAVGIPAGIALVATIPVDFMQVVGVLLRLAQELVYLYGGNDIEENYEVRKKIIIIISLILAGGNTKGEGSNLSKKITSTVLRRIPKRSLFNEFMDIIKRSNFEVLGYKLKERFIFKSSVKFIPFIGAVVVGSVNYMAMKPMANEMRVSIKYIFIKS